MTDTPAQAIQAEAPSGKGAGDENFPVGSFLIAKHLRPHIGCYYAFARAIDDVADDTELASEEKVKRLERFAAVLQSGEATPGYEKATALHQSMAKTQVPFRHGSDLTIAFVQDCRQNRYQNWDDLIGYCNNSASPVGRYLLDLHGEDPAGYEASDALCNALQVINHLQDMGKDKRDLDRIYIPQDWMAANGTGDADIDLPALTPGLRKTVDQCLDACQDLMKTAHSLPSRLKSRRLSWESGVIIQVADTLIARLRRQDPLATRVELSKPAFALTALRGWLRFL